jgi:hypothetical protein
LGVALKGVWHEVKEYIEVVHLTMDSVATLVTSHNTAGRAPIAITDPANGNRAGVRVTFSHNIIGTVLSRV